ncbi:MAG TPA: M14 family zinc carboxypeptidase [Actinomadura sp.]|nr:M14 family zinc carboxypeptidase [Actinomadura sp.]
MKARKIVGAAVLAVTIATPMSLVSSPAAARPMADPGTCDATRTTPVYRGRVPAPKTVLGFELGDRETTSTESDRYLDAVAKSSERVVSGVLATSAQGRPLKYAIVGRPEVIRSSGLARVRAEAALLRDPRTPRELADRLAERGLPILWVTANVHGDEPSGTEAALRVLRDLGDRSDCAAARILDNAVVIVLPTQNPDGRTAGTRQNAYGFDMNRDWFARTQPETDGKLSMLNTYPPVLYIDAHEMGGTDYFFPPNADPIHHEIAEPAVEWINNLYGAPMAAEFGRRGIPFFNRDVYDLFYMGYGDTVPIAAFNAAGMTFEKGGDSPYPARAQEQYLTQWVSLSSAAANREKILREWHQMSVEAYRQGKTGELEPNRVYNPPNQVVTPVPDRKVRHYFLRADDPAKRAEVQTVVRRLQRMGVTVGRLIAPLTVPDYKAYGRPAARTALPAGTYWISMAQGRKHWIQAMLGEDAYTPFPYFYDVTAWSLPLLANVSGGSSGAELRPRAVPSPVPPAPHGPTAPGRTPKVAVLQLSATSSTARQSTGWLRHRLEREWKLPFRLLSPADIAAGGLTGAEVLLVPGGPAGAAATALGDGGRAALRRWTEDGGRYVGWQGGAQLAAQLGLTTATLSQPTSDVPGTLFRVKVDPRSPLAEDVGGTAWQFYSYDLVMKGSHAAVTYPAADSPDWFVSGFQSGGAELAGTAAVIDEPTGRGRTVLFAAEPNFRAFTDGTAKMLYNAITGPDPSAARGGGSPGSTAAAVRAAAALPALESPIRVSVRAADAARTASALRSLGATWTSRSSGGVVHYLMDNPKGLPSDHHPYARRLPSALRGAGVTPVAVMLP